MGLVREIENDSFNCEFWKENIANYWLMLTTWLELTWAVVIVDEAVEDTGGEKGGAVVAVVVVGLRQLLWCRPIVYRGGNL